MLALSLLQIPAAGQVPVVSTTLLQTSSTVIGQPIEFPPLRNQFTVVLAEIAPGGQAGRHQHPFPLAVYVIDGALSVELEGHGAQTFTAGQAFAEAVNHWHNGLNRGSVPARFLIVFAAAAGKPPLMRSPDSQPVGFQTRVVLQSNKTATGQTIAFPLFKNQLTVVLNEWAPGAQTGRHQHPIPTLGYLLEGTITIEADGSQPRVIRAGEAWVETLNTWHNGYNQGPPKATAVVVFAGEDGTPNSIR
jgi:quercetin dioxygenase-like cupin family protein